MRKLLSVIPYLAALVLGGCSLDWLPFVYRLDIHQGNVVSQEMVDQLKPGMTKRQVAFIMGTPLLKDPFHDNRWDYIYSNQPGNEPRVQKSITLAFKDDELTGLQGDFKPGKLPSIEMVRDQTVIIPKIEREKTLWQKLTGVFSSDD
jgi:outer membrane protein assembly factor BamE